MDHESRSLSSTNPAAASVRADSATAVVASASDAVNHGDDDDGSRAADRGRVRARH